MRCSDPPRRSQPDDALTITLGERTIELRLPFDGDASTASRANLR